MLLKFTLLYKKNIKKQISNEILSSVVLISSRSSNKTFKYYLCYSNILWAMPMARATLN